MGVIEIVVGALGGGGAALLAAWLLFGVARRAMKLVVRVVLFGVICVALVIGVGAYWYSSSQKTNKPAKAGSDNRPTNSRRR